MVDEKEVTFSLNELRIMLKLPLATAKNNSKFVEPLDLRVMLEFLNIIKHVGHIRLVRQFYIKNLPQPWQTLVKILMRCLTTKVTGIDQPPLHMMKMFYCIVNNVHVYYVALIWEVHLDILKRTSEVHHYVANDEVVQLVFNSRKVKERAEQTNVANFDEATQVSISLAKSAKEYESQQNVKCIKQYELDEDVEMLVEGEDSVADKFADEMMLKIEAKTDKAELIQKKKKGSLEIKDTSLATPTRSPRTESLSFDKDKLLELTAYKPSSLLSKPTSDRIRHLRYAIARTSRRQGYMLQHMKKSPMPRYDMNTLEKKFEETLMEVLQREKTKANIASMVADAVRKEQEHHEDHHDDDALLEEERSVKRKRMSKKEYDLWAKNQETYDDEVPSEEVTPEFFVEKTRNKRSRFQLVMIKKCMQDALNDMMRSQCSSGEEHAYYLDQMKRWGKRNPNAPPRYMYNKDLFHLKNRNSETRKYVLSLHKVHEFLFPENDLKELNTRWSYIIGRLKKRADLDDVYLDQRIVDIIRFQYDQGHGQEFLKEIFGKRADEIYQLKVNLTAPKLTFPGIGEKTPYAIATLPFVGLIYENINKEKRIMDIDEIPKFCDVTLKRVLKDVKRTNLDVEHGYENPPLSDEDASLMAFYKEYIQDRLRHRDQMR
uniref:Uncharacterized protein n=1 Tax=Tanacetum cinerariifolium TaxID=118510 RepID=A0A699H4S1_TANCI|nr:hypothetical protein [Tanacetum cinerariifolium]